MFRNEIVILVADEAKNKRSRVSQRGWNVETLVNVKRHAKNKIKQSEERADLI